MVNLKKWNIYITLLAILVFLLPHFSVYAQETEGYAISIVKYALEDNKQLTSSIVLDGTKIETVTDQNGNELMRLPGVTYEVVRVTRQGEIYVPMTGEEAFQALVKTNAEGVAFIGGLAAGTYRVTEQANELIPSPMEPVIVRLPLVRSNGDALNHVYLYPKSNVVRPTSPPVNDSDTPSSIPQTSGNMGSLHVIVVLASGVIISGFVGRHLLKKKEI